MARRSVPLALHLPLGLCLSLALVALGAPLTAQTILPPPPVPAGNPTTPDKVLLGKALYWDEQLSSSRTVACGTCHVFANGGSDARTALGGGVHPGADGAFGTADDVRGSPGVVRHDANGLFVADATFGIRTQATVRKAPSPINAAYGVELFWDGRASSAFADPVTGAILLPNGGALESQVAQPPVNAVEMSHIGRTWTAIANDLAPLQPLALADQLPPALQTFVQNQTYAQLFQSVFGTPGVTPARLVFAIAAYERTLISDQSPFDLFLAGQGTLTSTEQTGLQKFQSLCATCHTDVLPGVLATGPVLHDFRNIGVRPIADDPGRFAVTNQTADRGRFKVPGLRNVALRAPYFHNGGKATLGDVVDFYSHGGDFHVNQDPQIYNMPGQLSLFDRPYLVAFLQSLTDPRVVQELPPFDRPRLWSEGADVPSVFGTGTAGSGGAVPQSVAVLPAFVGNPHYAVGVDHTAPGALHLLALDLTASATPIPVLGVDLYLGLSPAFVLLGMPQLTQGSAPGGGYGTFGFAVPMNPQAAGLSLYGQWFVFDPLGPAGLAASDAFALPLF